MNEAVRAIHYALTLDDHEGMDFLRVWNEGDTHEYPDYITTDENIATGNNIAKSVEAQMRAERLNAMGKAMQYEMTDAIVLTKTQLDDTSDPDLSQLKDLDID